MGALLAVLMLAGLALAGQTVSPRITMDDIETLIDQVAAEVGLSSDYIRAIIQIESGFNEMAANPSDPSYGLMQVTPPIARAYGGWQGSDINDLYDPLLNLRSGAGYLADLFNKYSTRYPGEWVQMYNEGETHFLKGERVQSYQAKFEAALLDLQG